MNGRRLLGTVICGVGLIWMWNLLGWDPVLALMVVLWGNNIEQRSDV